MNHGEMLNKAIELAIRAHSGQVDKAGAPYILHPLRVMLSRENELERICAVLHDVVEDSDISLETLQEEGFPEEILTVLDCLTKREVETYEDFIGRVLTNESACRVKLADLSDNMDLTRIADPTEKDRERILKYNQATARILEALPQKGGMDQEKVIKIDGCISIQPFMTHDDFCNRFLDFVKMHGWFFGGSTEEVTL